MAEPLDTHLLRVLYLVLQERSVSRAADRLGITQPAVSSALKRLREITGDELLVRTRNGMTPTERGRPAWPHPCRARRHRQHPRAGRTLRAGEVKAGLWRWCA